MLYFINFSSPLSLIIIYIKYNLLICIRCLFKCTGELEVDLSFFFLAYISFFSGEKIKREGKGDQADIQGEREGERKGEKLMAVNITKGKS